MDELATLERDGASAWLWLERADRRNALSIEMLDAVHQRLDELEDDPAVALVVTGRGPSFSAGMDLRQVLGGQETALELLRLLGRATLRLRGLSSVVLARVNGAAIGGGCGLACVADVAATHADAVIGFPEVDLGLCPAVVSPWVVRKIGAGPARRVLLSGGTMTGADAHRIGLVDHLAASVEQLDALVAEVVDRLCSGGARALAATKGLLNELDGSGDEAAIMRGASLSAEVLATPEAQAALRARLER